MKKQTGTRYVRYTVKDPKQFIPGTFFTLSWSGIAKRIIGRMRADNTMHTQAVLVPRDEYDRVLRVVMKEGHARLIRQLN